MSGTGDSAKNKTQRWAAGPGLVRGQEDQHVRWTWGHIWRTLGRGPACSEPSADSGCGNNYHYLQSCPLRSHSGGHLHCRRRCSAVPGTCVPCVGRAVLGKDQLESCRWQSVPRHSPWLKPRETCFPAWLPHSFCVECFYMAKFNSHEQGLKELFTYLYKTLHERTILLSTARADATGMFLFGYYVVSSWRNPVVPINQGGDLSKHLWTRLNNLGERGVCLVGFEMARMSSACYVQTWCEILDAILDILIQESKQIVMNKRKDWP